MAGGLLALLVIAIVFGTCFPATGGGHILAFTTEKATLSIDTTPSFLLILPEHSTAFQTTDLSRDRQEEVHEAERE